MNRAVAPAVLKVPRLVALRITSADGACSNHVRVTNVVSAVVVVGM